jgi:oligopeptide transport system permease protein
MSEVAVSIPRHQYIGESPWRAAWRRLRQNVLAMGGLVFLILLGLMCVIGPVVSPYKQSDQDLAKQAQSWTKEHWMGTDALGRDVATRVMYGGRVSLLVGIVATVVAACIGVTYGLISGLAGGRVDAVMMRIVDILYAFPFIVFVILLNAVLGKDPTIEAWTASILDFLGKIPGLKGALEDIGFNASFIILFAAIGAVEWLTMARVVRGQTLALRKQEFITAARAYGARSGRILWRHLLPNVIGSVIIYASLTVPGVMLLEGTLSFLGLGIQPPAPSWGTLINDGASQIETAPWLIIFPGAFFVMTLLALNFLGDGLRDALDPRSGK